MRAGDDEKFKKTMPLMNALDIPVEIIAYYHTGGPKFGPTGFPIGGSIDMYKLYDILADKDKRHLFISKLESYFHE